MWAQSGVNNEASNRATVGGGDGNRAQGVLSFVGGGVGNQANGLRATVAGGSGNSADGDYSTVPGGRENVASGDYSFAAGYGASAEHSGSFVWQDSTAEPSDVDLQVLRTTASNQFLARASGGFHLLSAPAPDTAQGVFIKDASLTLRKDGQSVIEFSRTPTFPGEDLTRWTIGPQASSDGFVLFANGAAGAVMTVDRSDGNIGFGTTPTIHPIQMASGAYVSSTGMWTNASSKILKNDFEPIDGLDILEQVAALQVMRWRYRNEPNATHMGPVAEDFFDAFGLGLDDATIGTVDADGVALAAIQGLYELVRELQAENEQMRAAMKRAGIE